MSAKPPAGDGSSRREREGAHVPVYQYACTECGEQLEVRQSFTDEALTVCPACEGRLRKVLSPVGVVFKGSGFYRTDSRAAANGGSGRSNSSSGAKGASESGGDKNGTSKEPGGGGSTSGSSSSGSSGS